MNNGNSELWAAMKSAKYRDTLDELKRVVNCAKDLDEVLPVMLNAMVDAVHAEAGTLWYYDSAKTGGIVPRAVYGGEVIEGFRLEFGEGVAGGVIKDGKSVLIEDCQKDPRWYGRVDASTGFQTKSMICVPLRLSKSELAFGSIQIINKLDGSLFDDKDLEFAELLSNEFSRLYIESDNNEVSIFGYDFNEAFSEHDEKDAVKKLLESLSQGNLDEKKKAKIVKYFIKIYRIIK